jgi:hypothetical protein
MKTVVIFFGVLGAIKSQDCFSHVNLGKSIDELLITKSSVTEECVNQLKFLDESLNDKSSSWASDSELKVPMKFKWFLSVSFDFQ